MSVPTFEHTRTALKLYDELTRRLATEWDFATTNEQVKALETIEFNARRCVQFAFFADTYDRNTLANCLLTDVRWLADLVAKYNACAEVGRET